MDNPSRILLTLDEHLEEPTRIILFGCAALYLGFDAAPPAIAESKDVDAIIPLGDLEALNEQFWKLKKQQTSCCGQVAFTSRTFFAQIRFSSAPDGRRKLCP
jgi:hypothetical protein